MKQALLTLSFLITTLVVTQAQIADNIQAQAKNLFSEKNYQEAAALLENNLPLFDADSTRASVCGSLSCYYLFAKDYPKAEETAWKGLKADSTQTWIKINLAHALLFQGKVAEAEEVYDELSRTCSDGYCYSEALLDNFEQFEKEGLIPENRKNDFAKMKINLEQLHQGELDFLNFHNFFQQKQYPEALAFIQSCKGTFPNPFAEMIVNGFTNIADSLRVNGDYKEAEPYYLEAKNSREKIVGKEHSDYAISLSKLGLLYLHMGDYANAEPYYLEAKNILEKTVGKGHSNYATILDNLGTIYQKTSNYAKAELYSLEAKNIREKTVGKEHSAYANSLNNLGLLYREIGDYAKAESYHLEAKDIFEKTVGKEHPNYATTLNNLGLLYSQMGDYAKAESYFLEAKNIKEKIAGKERPDYAMLLGNFGFLYSQMGDYAKTESYFLEAKNIFEKTVGKESPDYAISLTNLGFLYSQMRDYAKAEPYLLEAKNIFEKTVGKENLSYFPLLYNLGTIYQKTSNYAKAEPYFLEAKDIVEKVVGKEHSTYALSLNNIGLLYLDMDDYAKAEPYFLEAKNIWEKIFGKEHSDYSVSLHNLGGLHYTKGNYSQAETYFSESVSIFRRQIDTYFSFMSEKQRNAFWNKSQNNFMPYYSLAYRYPQPSVVSRAYDNTLFAKGLLLRTSNDIRDAIYNSKNKKLIDNYEELRQTRNQIDVLRQKADAKNKDYIQSLEARADSLDKSITITSSAYRDLKADVSMTWQDVQKQLQPNDVAVEFVHFRLYGTDSIMYVAMVLRLDRQAPQWIPLCTEADLATLLKTASANTQQQTQFTYRQNGAKIYAAVWQPLEEALAGAKTVYYAPSGLLHKLAFNALPTENETVLLSDKYDLNLVSSTRETARLKTETEHTTPQDATVYGGLFYDENFKSAAGKDATNHVSTTAQTAQAQQDRRHRGQELAGAETPDYELRAGSGIAAWNYLEGTRKETEQIVGELNNRKIPNRYLTELAGDEASFKQLNGNSSNVLFLATHGFFFPDAVVEQHDNLRQLLGGGETKRAIENPLLRSGLVLSKVNKSWLSPQTAEGEDNILTADEISKINLTNTKLVVLSACETGLGDVRNSEGVFGLQRAFKLAGAKSLIMSLWKVPDEATALLMSTFYKEWLGGASKQSAFKTAQKTVRSTYPQPFYWAAFVMMD